MSFIKIIDVPEDKNVYFIGDIHGNFELFEKTLKEIGITDDDVLISVGDLVDRGNNNAKCLFEFLNKDNRHMVIGNHEKLMMDAQNSREWELIWHNNGGLTTLNEIGVPGIRHFSNLLSTVPYLIEVNHRGYKIGVTHAGIPHYPSINTWDLIKEYTENNPEYRYQLIWDRDAIQYAIYDHQVPPNEKLEAVVEGVDYVIHGHTGVVEPLVFGNRVWLDTQFRNGSFTIGQMNTETMMIKFVAAIPDAWGIEAGFTIKEY